MTNQLQEISLVPTENRFAKERRLRAEEKQLDTDDMTFFAFSLRVMIVSMGVFFGMVAHDITAYYKLIDWMFTS